MDYSPCAHCGVPCDADHHYDRAGKVADVSDAHHTPAPEERAA